MPTYNRQYNLVKLPLASGGDSVKTATYKLDNEITGLVGALNNMGSAKAPYRQTVITGATDANGNLAYLTTSGLNVSVVASVSPLVVSLANGYALDGSPIDYLAVISADLLNTWALPASNTCYLYIDRNAADGTITYGYSLLSPVYSDAKPATPASGQHWFSPFSQKMLVWNGANWDVKQRVFLGTAVVGISTITLTVNTVTDIINSTGALAAITNLVNIINAYTFTEKGSMSNPGNGYVSSILELTRNGAGQYFNFDIQGTVGSATSIYFFTGSGSITHGALTSGATSMTVSNAITFTNGQYAVIDINGTPEVVQLNGGNGTTTITIARGQLGTSAVAHNIGIVLDKNPGNISISNNAPVSWNASALTGSKRDRWAYSVSGTGLASCNINCFQEWVNR